MKNLLQSLFVVLFLSLPFVVSAQGSNGNHAGGGNNGNGIGNGGGSGSGGGVPLDGGLSLLLVAGAGYGAKKVIAARKNAANQGK